MKTGMDLMPEPTTARERMTALPGKEKIAPELGKDLPKAAQELVWKL
uniref:Uncharacterized protein n=1 Tax=uncultured bacterium contig00042 TaxID=1181529 RepID=A0A806JZE5_9BACT|nr:hypothetical protein [uncultured bacterium contig00042]